MTATKPRMAATKTPPRTELGPDRLHPRTRASDLAPARRGSRPRSPPTAASETEDPTPRRPKRAFGAAAQQFERSGRAARRSGPLVTHQAAPRQIMEPAERYDESGHGQDSRRSNPASRRSAAPTQNADRAPSTIQIDGMAVADDGRAGDGAANAPISMPMTRPTSSPPTNRCAASRSRTPCPWPSPRR